LASNKSLAAPKRREAFSTNSSLMEKLLEFMLIFADIEMADVLHEAG
jgi:hypothetical protein